MDLTDHQFEVALEDEVHRHQDYISRRTYDRISPAARVILNVDEPAAQSEQ